MPYTFLSLGQIHRMMYECDTGRFPAPLGTLFVLPLACRYAFTSKVLIIYTYEGSNNSDLFESMFHLPHTHPHTHTHDFSFAASCIGSLHLLLHITLFLFLPWASQFHVIHWVHIPWPQNTHTHTNKMSTCVFRRRFWSNGYNRSAVFLLNRWYASTITQVRWFALRTIQTFSPLYRCQRP